MPGKIQKTKALAPVEQVQRRILLIRGQRVIIDADLAALYGVTTKRFNEQVKRNRARFPRDFMFRLTANEVRLFELMRVGATYGDQIGDRPGAAEQHDHQIRRILREAD